MSDWPRGMDVAPIGAWPGVLRAHGERKVSPFASTKQVTDRNGHTSWQRKEVSLTDTLQLLERELDALHASETELLVAVPRTAFRLDGRPRADAKPEHPGVILSFVTKVGHLSYPCDTFTTWQSNLRAIALALEALRKVDRYGVTPHGEQYRGFLAIDAGSSTAESAARMFLISLLPLDQRAGDDAALIRRAKAVAHPDRGGDADVFQQVLDAERTLLGRAAA